ncbi:hypothetical protein KC318_g6055 [Hortaea werneckii]|uniref:Transcription factor domain-containing protein n=1 Tax=Hortaea werneckii TaxID=91943 RepID=A0A3M6ZJI4_HORWE|nr:hypothetical protein KC334_g5896 [Hortaea werneckii]KAI7010809.1 hypothetical protein KC355_g6013 [Hortaea werneckii]KAI7667167.1 hypothetical protein KC318_g6055 [Hortaea werneckii]RMY15424.1 hypothetical protein D0867_06837 [Hortaea werneckii]RMY33320.1 hypothetical protein D0866_06007 [Hortaea werneckii]
MEQPEVNSYNPTKRKRYRSDEADKEFQAGPLTRYQQRSLPHVSTPLNGGAVDTSLTYPIPLNRTAKELVALIFTPDYGDRPHRSDWFTVGLEDQAAFHAVLANAALHLHDLRAPRSASSKESQLATFYHHLALTKVRTSLQIFLNSGKESPAGERERKLLQLIGSVSGMVCWADNSASAEQWQIHREGLLQLIRLRKRGLDGLPNHLRCTVSWVELRGALMRDTKPLFPLPTAWVQQFTDDRRRAMSGSPVSADGMNRVGQIRIAWRNRFPDDQNPQWLELFEDLVLLAPLVDADLASSSPGSGMEHLRDLPVWTNTLIHKALSLERPMAMDAEVEDASEFGNSEVGKARGLAGQDENIVMAEACRLAILLFLAPVWRAYGVQPVPAGRIASRMGILLKNHAPFWCLAVAEAAFARLLSWMLCVLLTEVVGVAPNLETELDGLDDWALQVLAALHNDSIRDARDVEQTMKATLWIREIFDDKMRLKGAKLRS